MENTFIQLLDQRAKILWANLPEIWDKSLLECVHPDDLEHVESHLTRCIVRGETTSCQARWYCPAVGGKLVCAQTYFFPILRQIIPAAIAVHNILVDSIESFNGSDREVLGLLSKDQSIAEIAQALDRSPSTIDSRIRSLKERLNQKTLHGLVAAAMRGGLLSKCLNESGLLQLADVDAA
jgi:DNA-binding CsgD family transcriptional regulator